MVSSGVDNSSDSAAGTPRRQPSIYFKHVGVWPGTIVDCLDPRVNKIDRQVLPHCPCCLGGKGKRANVYINNSGNIKKLKRAKEEISSRKEGGGYWYRYCKDSGHGTITEEGAYKQRPQDGLCGSLKTRIALNVA